MSSSAKTRALCQQCDKPLSLWGTKEQLKAEIARRMAAGRPEKWCLLCKSCAGKLRWQNPAHKAKQSELMTERWATPELRADLLIQQRNSWTEDRRARHSEQQKARFQDPKERQKLSAASRAAWSSPELKTKQSNIQKEKWQDPDIRKRRIEGIVAVQSDLAHSSRVRSGTLKGIRKGNFYSARQDKKIRYDSSLELQALELMEANLAILSFDRCRERFVWAKTHVYCPDFTVTTSATEYIVEIKGAHFMGPEVHEKAAAVQEQSLKPFLLLVNDEIQRLTALGHGDIDVI